MNGLGREALTRFSPAGSRLASGSQDGYIKIWDAREISPEERRSRSDAFDEGLPGWHAEVAAEAEKAGNWFAAAFHLSRLDALKPGRGETQERLQKANSKLKSMNVPRPARANDQ